MADTVTSQVLTTNKVRHVALFTSISDGTGESDVKKVDISELVGAPTKVKINRIKYDISGMAVKVSFDHTLNDTVLVLSGQGCFDFTNSGGLQDPDSAGSTGDILFSTVGHAANDTYSILLDVGIKS